ncbi:MAG: homocysteine S-methyltransferase family protein [Pseudomonadota bacterium]
MTELTLLDGGMGQELIARTRNDLSPLWSAFVMMNEPEIVEAVHREYVEAGAQYITLNTYSATPERLARDATEDLFEPLQSKAIEIAKRACEGSNAKIAGCLSPPFGSYYPEKDANPEVYLRNYSRAVDCQKQHVDVFLCETMSSITEATTATSAVKESGKPAWCALSVMEQDGTRLRSGEPLDEAIHQVKEAGADAILLNCSPPEAISAGVKILAKCGVPFGAYANGFTKADDLQLGGTVEHLQARKDLGPNAYADFCSQWVEDGATIIGGCCEVGPAHITELRRRFLS